MNSQHRVAANLRCQLGEGPIWSARDAAVYWVDILAPAVHRYVLHTQEITTWRMPEKIGWLIERRHKPGFIAGFQSGIYELLLEPLTRRCIAAPEAHLPRNRMNDAKVDPFGRIWAGTMHCDGSEPSGSLYRLDEDLRLTSQRSGYLITNGPAFGVQGECMFHNDTGRGLVYRFELSAEGELGPRTEFLHFDGSAGAPDGMTVDAQGGLWIAHWGGARLCRYTSTAELSHRIDLPASQITSCVFAGADLDRLFVTSAAIDRADEPFAGALFEVAVPGIAGLPPTAFAG